MSRTLFIHIPRTGGTSIQQAGIAVNTRNAGLKKDIQKQMEMDPRSPQSVSPHVASMVQKHIPYSFLDREFLNRYDRVFSIVRNPWARLVSLYNHKDSVPVDGSWQRYRSTISWEDYLNRMDDFIMTPSYYWAHPYDQWGTQSDWVDIRKVNILRYENLQEDLNSYFNKSIDLPLVNQSKVVDYRTYYTDEQIEKVAKWYKLDIAQWGFNFDTGATKNYWSLA